MWWFNFGGSVVLLLILLYVGATLLGMRAWSAATRELETQLVARRVQSPVTKYRAADLQGLPEPVQRYFRAVLKDGQPIVTATHLAHRGSFNLGTDGDQWKPFESKQWVVTRPPGFVWDGRIASMPGVAVHVHDAYIAGEGILHPAVMGVIPLGRQRDRGDLARGELMRFLAEAAWYPTALLPSQGVRWNPVDDRSARAILVDGDVEVALTFFFGADDRIDRVRADARVRKIGDRAETLPWQGRFWNYAEHGGMLVPREGEVAWITPRGEAPYWRGTLTSIGFEFGDTGSVNPPGNR